MGFSDFTDAAKRLVLGENRIEVDILEKSETTKSALNRALKETHQGRYLPDDKWKWAWDITLLIGVLVYSFIVPLSDMNEDNWQPDELFIVHVFWTVIYALDVYINLNMAVVHNMKILTDRKDVIKYYMKRWFLVDLLAALPLDVCFWFVNRRVALIFSHLKLLKLLKVPSLFQLSNPGAITSSYVYFHFHLVPVITLFFWFVLLIHLFAVIWMGLSEDSMWTPNVDRYIQSLYFVLYTVTTVGFGDVKVLTAGQHNFSIFLFLTAMMLNGVLIAKLSSQFLKSDVKNDRKDKMRETLSVMRYFNIPEELQKEVLAFQNHILQYNVSAAYAQIIEGLPQSMQDHIGLYIRIKFISMVPLFQSAPPECRVALAQSLQTVVIGPEQYIIQEGDEGREMFFLGHGYAEVSKEGNSIASIKKGGFFGEAALLSANKRAASIKALTYCDLFRLDKEDFVSILDKFPQFKCEIERQSAVKQVKETRIAVAQIPTPAALGGTVPSSPTTTSIQSNNTNANNTAANNNNTTSTPASSGSYSPRKPSMFGGLTRRVSMNVFRNSLSSSADTPGSETKYELRLKDAVHKALRASRAGVLEKSGVGSPGGGNNGAGPSSVPPAGGAGGLCLPRPVSMHSRMRETEEEVSGMMRWPQTAKVVSPRRKWSWQQEEDLPQLPPPATGAWGEANPQAPLPCGSVDGNEKNPKLTTITSTTTTTVIDQLGNPLAKLSNDINSSSDTIMNTLNQHHEQINTLSQTMQNMEKLLLQLCGTVGITNGDNTTTTTTDTTSLMQQVPKDPPPVPPTLHVTSSSAHNLKVEYQENNDPTSTAASDLQTEGALSSRDVVRKGKQGGRGGSFILDSINVSAPQAASGGYEDDDDATTPPVTSITNEPSNW